MTSPPYDVISPGTLDRLLAASPYNIVRLILPEADPVRGGDALGAGELAAARLGAWLADGVLAADDEAALYVYEQRGPGFVQRGLIGLVGVASAAIHPHEDVMPGPVAGRRELMAVTRSNLEPILLVYNGAAAGLASPALPTSVATRLVQRTADERPPLARAVTDDGIAHRLWALTDPADQAAIAADLATRTALIADGHHRYAAYGQLRDRMRAGGHGEGPWDFGLAFLVDADAYPLSLGPIHRVLPGLDPATAARLAAGAFIVTGLSDLDAPGGPGGPGAPYGPSGPSGPDGPGGADELDEADGPGGLDGELDGMLNGELDGELDDGEAGRLAEALRRLAAAGKSGPAFLLAGQDGFTLLSAPDRDQLAAAMPDQASPRWRALDAAVLQELLLARLWSIPDNEREVLIEHDAAEAVRLARQSGGTAVLCNPMLLTAVADLAAHGERVPRKSTSFGPKPRTGLILRTFD